MDLEAIGRQFGLNEAQTRAALDALTPVVAAGVRRSAQSPEGLQDIFRTVLTGGYESSLGDPDAVRLERAKPAGDEILKQIFGNKDVSRGVAQQLSATSGIGAAILKQLLPIVASLVLGKLAKGFGGGAAPANTGGGLGDILKDTFGGGSMPSPAPSPQQRAPQPMPAPSGDDGGLGMPTPRTGTPRQGGSPGGLEDILNDILNGNQGRGGVVVKRLDPDQMGEILKDIFGGGFPGGGQMPENTRPNTRPMPRPEAVERGRRTIEDATGGGTPSGNDADILLNGVEKAIRRG
jgi:hypothetical protein